MKKIILILLIIGLITILFVSCIPSVPPPPSEGEGEEEEVEPPTSRVVLVELFNTQGCPACAQINPIVEEVAQEYDKSQVILIEEAGWGLYSTPETSERYRWYLPESKERTTPNILFNGLNQRIHPGASAGGGEAPTNHRPIINSTPPTTATVEIVYSYQVMATDADGDSLAYSLNTAPEGMVIEVNTGLLTWTPTEEQVGEQEVEVEVSDGKKAAKQEFVITVEDTEDTVYGVGAVAFVGDPWEIDGIPVYGLEDVNFTVTFADAIEKELVKVYVGLPGLGPIVMPIVMPPTVLQVAMTTADEQTYEGTVPVSFIADLLELLGWDLSDEMFAHILGCVDLRIYVLAGDPCCIQVCEYPFIVDPVGPYAALEVIFDTCDITAGGCWEDTPELGYYISIDNVEPEDCDPSTVECCGDTCSGLKSWEATICMCDPFDNCDEWDECLPIMCVYDSDTGTTCPVELKGKCVDADEPMWEDHPFYLYVKMTDNVGNITEYKKILTFNTGTVWVDVEDIDTGHYSNPFGFCIPIVLP